MNPIEFLLSEEGQRKMTAVAESRVRFSGVKRRGRIKVFISSPYRKGGVEKNVQEHLNTFDTLLNYGFAPFAPLLFHFAKPRRNEDWLDLTREYVTACDVLIRLPGESEGADAEVEYAKSLGIPVVNSVRELVEWTVQKMVREAHEYD